MVPNRFNSLTLKLTLLAVAFAVVLATATALLVTRGFGQAQRSATGSSVQALESQGRASLLMLTQREVQIGTGQLAAAALAGHDAARYLVAATQLGVSVPWDPVQRLRRSLWNQFWDPTPGRQTDVFIPKSVQTIDGQIAREVRQSAPLDSLFPALLAENHDAVAIYFIGSAGVTRFYPVTGRPFFMPPDYNMVRDTSYTDAIPSANSARRTVWRSPYVDVVGGQGVLVTASTPVYDGNRFLGVIAVDVALHRLIAHLNSLQPTPSGFAFLIDRQGRLVAASPNALRSLVGAGSSRNASVTTTVGLPLAAGHNAAFRRALQAMQAERRGVQSVTLAGRPAFLAYAPLSDEGWSLGLVAPIDEMTQQSSAVTTAIRSDALVTTWSTLLGIGLCFIVALLALVLLSRRMLLRPITALVVGTRAVASGRLHVTIPVVTSDELGQLAASFNRMTDELRQARESLEQRVQERTHELSTLLDVSRTVASTLEISPLLDIVLAQLKGMVDYTGAAILTLRDDELTVLEYFGPAPRDLVVGLRWRVEDASSYDGVILSRQPVILSDVEGNTALGRAYEAATGESWARAFGDVRAWMGVPLLLQERVVGLLAVVHGEPDHYTPHHAQLALAIAAQAAIAIENARLYAEAREHAALMERARLARELHDSVTQALFSMTLHVRAVELAQERAGIDANGPLGRGVRQVAALAQGALAEMRALIFELRPGALAEEGLAAALRKQAAALAAREDIVVDVEAPEERIPLDEATEEHLYRLALEALHNVVKHAGARRALIRLTARDDPGAPLELEVSDDGMGFDTAASRPGHMGLHTMADRARHLGGALEIESRLGQGTRVRVVVPSRRAGRVDAVLVT